MNKNWPVFTLLLVTVSVISACSDDNDTSAPPTIPVSNVSDALAEQRLPVVCKSPDSDGDYPGDRWAMTPADECVRPNKRVVTRGNSILTIREVLGNGFVSAYDYENPGYQPVLARSEFAIEVARIAGWESYEVGKTVIDSKSEWPRRYQLNAIFANGKILVQEIDFYGEGIARLDEIVLTVRDVSVQVREQRGGRGEVLTEDVAVFRPQPGNREFFCVKELYSNGRLYATALLDSSITTFLNANEVWLADDVRIQQACRRMGRGGGDWDRDRDGGRDRGRDRGRDHDRDRDRRF